MRMGGFIGRAAQLARLDGLLEVVTEGAADRLGKAVLMRGRRRVGKSRLVEVFVDRADLPYLYFTASTRTAQEELRLFAEEVAVSNLPGAELFEGVRVDSWDAALRLLVRALPQDSPSVVVIDELPYLVAADPGFEGTLQKVFDRELSRLPTLLIGIGSDLAMMEALNTHGRPFYQRATEMVIPPLTPREVGTMLELSPADAFDAYLVTGGLPLICTEWGSGRSLEAYLRRALRDPTSALIVSGERVLAAEFPTELQARLVLGAIGSGDRSFTNVSRAAGIQAASLGRSLSTLTAKRIVSADLPLSTRPSRETRYRIEDPYLRFWLTFVGPYLHEVERGRGDRVVERVKASWTAWRGRTVEPVLRQALERLPDDETRWGRSVVGGYWTRTNDVEIDLVVADRAPVAKVVEATGSIKWLERRPFDNHDLAELLATRGRVPGADVASPPVVVSRSGCTVDGVRHYGPEQLLAGWE